jgi:hypothetical protein
LQVDRKLLTAPDVLSGVADETAYFVNSKLPCFALIAKGVRFPAGQWIRVADGKIVPWLAEKLVIDLFPALKDKPLTFAVLLTEFDVHEFERECAGST